MKYRKKPIEIEAWQFTGMFDTDPTQPEWVRDYRLGSAEIRLSQDGKLRVPTLEGDIYATRGDWIIKGIQGECYPCKPDIFEATYDVVD